MNTPPEPGMARAVVGEPQPYARRRHTQHARRIAAAKQGAGGSMQWGD